MDCQACSFAITQSRPWFQAIHVCRSCCEEAEAVLCVCSACLDACHADHDTEYVGMGPSFCDCKEMGFCQIVVESTKQVRELGISRPISIDNVKVPTFPTLGSTYSLLNLSNDLLSELNKQSILLSRQTKDTHWIDRTILATQGDQLCCLEELASKILHHHADTYSSESDVQVTSIGAEWWVQVKTISSPPNPEYDMDTPQGDEAVDVHFDKDEALASMFQLGRFPALSTVTYLSEQTCAPPTIVFGRTYEDPAEQGISTILVSHPFPRKHLVFDGRLLHGAPSHFALRRTKGEPVERNDETKVLRVTFLVNIWVNHKPVQVQPLSHAVRKSLMADLVDKTSVSDNIRRIGLESSSVMDNFTVDSPRDLPPNRRQRITLPFVGGRATWAESNDDALAVITTYPPPLGSDTVFLRLGPDMVASLEYESDDESEEDSELL